MDKFWSYLGGVIGGYTLVQAPLGSFGLGGLEPVLDIVGALSMIVFGAALVVKGVFTLVGK
ncbi:hypothetical protein FE782_15630 [Paenibacillus antri]|uniref:Uncharacterized protein n=1 Tax=Paenibacillus antri TaxID=2582848 RepID=A0A5R9G9Y1_9BACL|nr:MULTISPECIES: hypothetical protein [Paenibacillus]TLS51166.1 hypothetical protein FE782_15630 [Paenibacillus antri]HZG76135.1 hypothetical protein [Paenibacillus sp.]